MQELLNGHPKCIHTQLGVDKEVFLALRVEIWAAGHTDSHNGVSLDEQLAIFLYTCVTGITVWYVGEWFQRVNATTYIPVCFFQTNLILLIPIFQ